MTESRKITQHDIEVMGFMKETTKGTPDADMPYLPFPGIVQEITYAVDDARADHWRDGDGPMISGQTRGQRRVSGKIHYKLNKDLIDFGDRSPWLGSMIAFACGSVSLHEVTGRILPRGTKYLEYDGGASFVPGMIVTGVTSAATAVVKAVLVTDDDPPSGILVIEYITGVFQDDETITQGDGGGAAIANGSQKTVHSVLESFTVWVKQRGIDYNHVFAGVHIRKLDIRGMENGDVEFDMEFQAMDFSETAPTGCTLPAAPDDEDMPFFEWTSDHCTSLTLTRAATNARIKTFTITLDNGELDFIPHGGQRTACDLVPGKLDIYGDLNFFTTDGTLLTLWNTDPQCAKTLEVVPAVGPLTVGEVLMGQTSGATARITAIDGNTITVKKVRGVFALNEIASDETGNTGTVGVVLADPSSLDFEITLNKDAGAQYLKIGCYNTHPRGSKDISFLPQSDDEFMIKYPFKVEGYDNFYAMVLYTAPPT